MPRDCEVGPSSHRSRPTAVPALRRVYRLTVVCHSADSDGLQAELKRQFDECGLMLQSLSCDHTSYVFVRISALVASSIPERAALVRIVNRLAAEPTVRRLQWETVPSA